MVRVRARNHRPCGGSWMVAVTGTPFSPATAQTFVSLGHGLGALRCLPNLREGLRYCLAARREQAARRGQVVRGE